MERRLPALLPPEGERPESVHRAMRYAALGPGKRIRPVLTLAVADLFGARDLEPVVDLGAAVELVHACSLVLDDLPAMDDAELRRGRAAVHRVFGENVALLGALALLNEAYALVAATAQRLGLARDPAAALVQRLAGALGTRGLIGGQALDLESRPEALDLEQLETLQARKTGALFVVAAQFGALAADAGDDELEAVSRFARELGLAFQIEDDLLDALAASAESGKDAGQDARRGSFVGLLGIAGARRQAEARLAAALAAIERFGPRADPLRGLARIIGHRTTVRAAASP